MIGKEKNKSNEMIIRGFWHMYLINHWYSIVQDQLRIMLTSGLYDACNDIQIGVIAPDEKELDYLEKYIVEPHPKLKIAYRSTEAKDYEFRTLGLIQNSLVFNEKNRIVDYAGFYIHTKSVSKPFDTVNNHWRAWLNEAILNRWKEHYTIINNGQADISGVNYCQPPKHPKHFSGNFWWFDSEYITTLPDIYKIDWTNRYNAEQWICKGKGRVHAGEFIEPGEQSFTILRR